MSKNNAAKAKKNMFAPIMGTNVVLMKSVTALMLMVMLLPVPSTVAIAAGFAPFKKGSACDENRRSHRCLTKASVCAEPVHVEQSNEAGRQEGHGTSACQLAGSYTACTDAAMRIRGLGGCAAGALKHVIWSSARLLYKVEHIPWQDCWRGIHQGPGLQHDQLTKN